MSTSPDGLGKDARALIRAARGGDDVPPEERRRVLSAFAHRQAADEASAGRAGAARPWRGRRAAPRLSWAVAALVLTGSLAALAQQQGLIQRLGEWIEQVREAPQEPALPGAATRVAERRSPAVAVTAPEHVVDAVPDAAPAPSSTPRARVLDAVPEPVEPARASAARASAARETSAQAAAPTPLVTQGGFDPAELELIAAARTALAKRQFVTARQRAEQHATRFPGGTFSEEREAILALCDCRTQAGSERGQRFVRERPASLLAERVRRDCGLSTNLVPGSREPGTH